jgi:hypothetical protein
MLFNDVLDMGGMSGFIDSSPHMGFSSFQWIVVSAIPIGSHTDPFPAFDGARHWIVVVIHSRTRTRNINKSSFLINGMKIEK